MTRRLCVNHLKYPSLQAACACAWWLGGCSEHWSNSSYCLSLGQFGLKKYIKDDGMRLALRCKETTWNCLNDKVFKPIEPSRIQASFCLCLAEVSAMFLPDIKSTTSLQDVNSWNCCLHFELQVWHLFWPRSLIAICKRIFSRSLWHMKRQTF